MTPALAIQLAIGLPLAGSVLILLLRRWPNLRESVTVVTSLILFGLVLQVLPEVLAGRRPAVSLLEVVPGIRLAFEVEPLGMLFALVASSLWIATGVYAIGYMRSAGEHKQARFFACFPVALSGAVGIAFSANLFTLFIFYEVLTLSTYPLVAHKETDEARRGARLYLGMLVGTSIALLLVAIVWTWQLAGTLDFRPGGILDGHIRDAMVPLLLALYMFGIGKAALMPFHRWLPAAMVAPTPVSALLHAVAVVKAGVFTVLKVITYTFGLDLLTRTGASVWLMYVAAFTLITASLVALTRDDLKARLAYSTVSQLSYIVLGGALATGWGLIGGGMHIVMHAFGKITLFFCAGAISIAAHKTRVSELNGIGRRMPVTMTAFLIGTLSIIGLPPAGGLWSKWFLAFGAADSDRLLFIGVLMLSSLLNIGYLMPIVARAFFLPPPAGETDTGRLGEAPISCVLPLGLTAAGCVALFFLSEPLAALLAPLATPATGGVETVAEVSG